MGWMLRVTDDGRGLRGDGPMSDGSGFGLISIRDRADSLGGLLTLREPPGGGTELEVVLP
jgi:signal transduction histidine kinase